MNHFNDFGLHTKILKAIREKGYKTPTEIQSKAIPEILAGSDLRASAQTGTGKTAAFLLPALQRLVSNEKGKGPRILILTPTRELAIQIAGQADQYSRHLPFAKTVCLFGGVPYLPQTRKLSRPHEILIATPGRLLDMMGQGKIDFSRVEVLVLDEADRMLDMGFVDPVHQIADATPSNRQTLLFSATLDKSIIHLSKKLLKDPIELVISKRTEIHRHIKQSLYFVDDLSHKNRLLAHLLEVENPYQTIIFTATKRHADQLADRLANEGHKAQALHGDMNQRRRDRTIRQFKKGAVQILVATDIAARGIDIESISHVINFDLPQQLEDYVHRIGRTGRAGASGTAISFVSPRERPILKKIESYTGQAIQVAIVDGLKPSMRKEHKSKRRFSKKCNDKSRSSPSKRSYRKSRSYKQR